MTRRDFCNVPDEAVIYCEDVMTTNVCVTNIGTSCIFCIRQLISYIQFNLADFGGV